MVGGEEFFSVKSKVSVVVVGDGEKSSEKERTTIIFHNDSSWK